MNDLKILSDLLTDLFWVLKINEPN